LDVSNPKSFQKTFVHKDAGKNPVWNQSFNVPLNNEPELFVEIMDEEMTADAVIGFAAIPLAQVINAPGSTFFGIFDLYTTDSKQVGQVTLTLTAVNVPGSNAGYGGQAPQGATPIHGQTHMNELHQKRIKSIKNKEFATEAGIAVLGSAFAIGAGLLLNKHAKDEHHKDEVRKENEVEAALEREKYENEKKELDEQRAAFEKTKAEQQAKLERDQEALRIQQQQQQSSQEERHGGHHHHGHRGSWNATTTIYKKGEKVTYQGREFICIQEHTSNATWEPTQAHSLWRAE
jgi:Ca2+-dependent lipid-binding protein